MDKPDPDAPLPPFGSADFHSIVQKQIGLAAQEAIGNAKLDWKTIAPFLEAAREMCRADIHEGAGLRLHAEQEEGEDAEEAFLDLSLADRDDGMEWLSESWWISDLAIAEEDPARVEAIARALERSVARIDAWLAERAGNEAGPSASDRS